MAIAITNLLQESSTTGGDPVTTAGSITTVAGRLYFVSIESSTTPTVVSVTLPGTITMVLLKAQAIGTVAQNEVWWGVASAGGTGTVTVDFSAATTGTVIHVEEITGFNAATPTAQALSAEGNSGTATVTLAAFGDAVNNAVFQTVVWALNSAPTPEAGYTTLGSAGHGVPNRWAIDAWKIGEDTSPTTTHTSDRWGIIGVEINADAGVVDANAEVAWTEFEVPTANAAAEISFMEFEVPTANSAAEISFMEFEVPTADSEAQIVWAELEVPLADAQAEISFMELEVPDFGAPPPDDGGGRRNRTKRYWRIHVTRR